MRETMVQVTWPARVLEPKAYSAVYHERAPPRHAERARSSPRATSLGRRGRGFGGGFFGGGFGHHHLRRYW